MRSARRRSSPWRCRTTARCRARRVSQRGVHPRARRSPGGRPGRIAPDGGGDPGVDQEAGDRTPGCVPGPRRPRQHGAQPADRTDRLRSFRLPTGLRGTRVPTGEEHQLSVTPGTSAARPGHPPGGRVEGRLLAGRQKVGAGRVELSPRSSSRATTVKRAARTPRETSETVHHSGGNPGSAARDSPRRNHVENVGIGRAERIYPLITRLRS